MFPLISKDNDDDKSSKICTVNGHSAWLRAQLKRKELDFVEYEKRVVEPEARDPEKDEREGTKNIRNKMGI